MNPRRLPSLTALVLLLAQPAPGAAAWDCKPLPDGQWDCTAPETTPATATFPAAPAPAPADTATDTGRSAPETEAATPEALPGTTDTAQPALPAVVTEAPGQPDTAEATPAAGLTAAAPDTVAADGAPFALPAPAAGPPQDDTKTDRWALCPPVTQWMETGEVPAEAGTAGMVDLEADSAAASADRVYTLSGDAVVRYGDRRLTASDMVYRQQTGEIEASGGIHLTGPDLLVSGESARLQLQEDRGTLSGITYALPGQHARGAAGQLSLVGAGQLRLEDASYTTCAPGNRDWLLSAGEVEIDHGEGTVTARNARLNFKRVPLLYTPYISFPLDDRRKSGLLFPKLGTTDETGIDVSIPYYWNIAPNRDATFTPRVMTDRGTMLGGEFRFLTPHSNGVLGAEYLPSDKEFGDESRRFVSLSHTASPTPRLETRIVAGDVSDPFYFGDLGTDLMASSQTSLERTANAIWHGGGWNLGLTVQDFQNLDTTIASADRPYRQLPQIVYELVPAQRFLGLSSSVQAELNYFTHSDDTVIRGTRIDLQPRLSLPLRRSAWYVEPAAGLRHTAYWLENNTPGADESPDRTTPVYSVDAGMFFERSGRWSNRPYIQTLEPRLFYLYVPERDQNGLPVFDTGNYDFNFWTLFRENRFNGPDRMGDANQLALALTSRFLDTASGRQLLRMSLGSLFYFKDRTVTLPGDTADLDSSSDIIGEVSLALTSHWSARGEVLWNPHLSRTERNNYRLQYRLGPRRLVNLGYRFRDGIQEQSDVSFLWPVGPSWHLVGRWYYDLNADETIETLGGLAYERCCWGVQLLARNYINNDGTARTTAVFLQLEFKGLGKLGTSVDDALERGILGYESD